MKNTAEYMRSAEPSLSAAFKPWPPHSDLFITRVLQVGTAAPASASPENLLAQKFSSPILDLLNQKF